MIKITEDLRQMRIVVIDALESDRNCLHRALSNAGFEHVSVQSDANAALSALSSLQPDLVCLELHMATSDGRPLLLEITQSMPGSSKVPIIVFARDADTAIRRWALENGANDLVAKPIEPTDAVIRVRNFLETRRLYKELERYSLDLEQTLLRRTSELREAADDCLLRLAKASEYRDDDTGEHTVRVGHLSAQIALALGLPSGEVELVRRAAPLHDIGKIGIPDSILLKPGKLTAEEFDVVRSHVKVGARLLSGSSSKLMAMAEKIALTHHERWDGTGYSLGLRGEEIPLPGRIVAVADVYDALTHDRPYKQAWPVEKAVEEVRSQSGKHFDPAVVDAFLKVFDERPTFAVVYG